jgi:hypothetical protein
LNNLTVLELDRICPIDRFPPALEKLKLSLGSGSFPLLPTSLRELHLTMAVDEGAKIDISNFVSGKHLEKLVIVAEGAEIDLSDLEAPVLKSVAVTCGTLHHGLDLSKVQCDFSISKK